MKHLFHIDASIGGLVTCMYKKDLPDLHQPYFKGLYPGFESSLLKAISGQSTGLDFINAIEADKIVFVEGEDDARLLYHLMMTNVANQNRKVVFWVMGGVSQIINNLGAYKTVLSSIKNGISLWDKTVLVFDCDRLIDEHLNQLKNNISSEYGIPVYVPNMYTEESVALSDFSILTELLIRALSLDPSKRADLTKALQSASLTEDPAIRKRYSDLDNPFVQSYKGIYLEPINHIKKNSIKIPSDIDLKAKLESQYTTCPLLRLANKDDVATIINNALKVVEPSATYAAERFDILVEEAEASTLFDEWKKLIQFLSK